MRAAFGRITFSSTHRANSSVLFRASGPSLRKKLASFCCLKRIQPSSWAPYSETLVHFACVCLVFPPIARAERGSLGFIFGPKVVADLLDQKPKRKSWKLNSCLPTPLGHGCFPMCGCNSRGSSLRILPG